MPKCIIDGREAEFSVGENIVDIAKRIGVSIPVFCYHPGLSVVAQCRMCTVEVEKMGKLQTGCSTPATDGMVIHTNSQKVLDARQSTMEFLLVNHPLDCPICDKSGECDLQDYSFEHGSQYSRYTEERRTYVDLDMGPVIQKNMNRCIHCTRCIRFADEIAKLPEMVAMQRGNATEITTADGRPLETDYAGNYSDICPTGSLTLKDFRFHKRAWFLKKTPTICAGCSRGCSIELQTHDDHVYRIIPRENQAVNQYWMCDEGRFMYHAYQEESRLCVPWFDGQELAWQEALQQLRAKMTGALFLVATDLTHEEVDAVSQLAQFYGAQLLAFGSDTDADYDAILRRTNMAANFHGLKRRGLSWYAGQKAELVIIVRAGRTKLPQLGETPWVGMGVFWEKEKTPSCQGILPGLSYLEKNGTVTNFQGTDQALKQAVAVPGMCRSVPEIVMQWMHGGERG